MTPYELVPRPSDVPDLVLVDIGGELDLTNAREVEERLEDLAAGTGSSLVLDLNRLVFIDSAAIHVLFRLARRLGKDRFGVVFEDSAAVARTLSIVGLAEVATVVDSRDDLVGTLGAA